MTTFNKLYYELVKLYCINGWLILSIIYLFCGTSPIDIKHFDIINNKFITMNIYQSYIIYTLQGMSLIMCCSYIYIIIKKIIQYY